MPAIKTLAQGAKESIIWQVMCSEKLRHGLRDGGVLANRYGTLGVSANQEIVAIFEKARSFLKAFYFMEVAGNDMIWNFQKHEMKSRILLKLEDVDPRIAQASKEVMDFRKLVLKNPEYRFFRYGLKRYGLSFSDLSPCIATSFSAQDAKGETIVFDVCEVSRVSSEYDSKMDDDLLGY